jgi:hypothetical protein
MSAVDRWFVALFVWLAVLEEGADMRWPDWLYKLNDPLDEWFGNDKAFHAIGAAAALLKSRELLTRWDCAPWAVVFWSWVTVLVAITLVEAVELVRWDRWQEKGAPQPWPVLTDRVSLKDIAWGLLGAWMATW